MTVITHSGTVSAERHQAVPWRFEATHQDSGWRRYGSDTGGERPTDQAPPTRPDFPPPRLGLLPAFSPELGDAMGGDVMWLWAFLHSFGALLGIRPVSVEDLLESLVQVVTLTAWAIYPIKSQRAGFFVVGHHHRKRVDCIVEMGFLWRFGCLCANFGHYKIPTWKAAQPCERGVSAG